MNQTKHFPLYIDAVKLIVQLELKIKKEKKTEKEKKLHLKSNIKFPI